MAQRFLLRIGERRAGSSELCVQLFLLPKAGKLAVVSEQLQTKNSFASAIKLFSKCNYLKSNYAIGLYITIQSIQP